MEKKITNTIDPQWEPIYGFEGLYEWSPIARLVRVHKTHIYVAYENIGNEGRSFLLKKNGMPFGLTEAEIIYSNVHQVEIPRGYQVHHIDWNFDNNAIDNLELITCQEAEEKLLQYLRHIGSFLDSNRDAVLRYLNVELQEEED